MFGRNAKTEIDSLVGISARIEGNLCFTGGLRIDGEVHGDVIGGDSAENVLIVSEHARIEGDVHCGTLIVQGYIAGDVFATELLELQPKGRIIGNVHYKKLEMHSGATVAGTLTHQAAGEPVFHMAITQPGLSKVSEAGGAPRVYNE
jgi:cytoskeletal protein CcmA (bactofilin family)